jgi:hypothetical protein
MGWYGLDWSDSEQGQVEGSCEHDLRIPLIVGMFLSSCKIGGFSRRAQIHEVSSLVSQCISSFYTI